MIDLQPSKRFNGDEHVFRWLQSPPFFLNPRGVLVHRVRHVQTYFRAGTETHHSVGYLCGNGCCFDLDSTDSRFYDDPPQDRLVCAFCEAAAARKGKPSADKLAGRHVHRGVLKAHRVCCKGASDAD